MIETDEFRPMQECFCYRCGATVDPELWRNGEGASCDCDPLTTSPLDEWGWYSGHWDEYVRYPSNWALLTEDRGHVMLNISPSEQHQFVIDHSISGSLGSISES